MANNILSLNRTDTDDQDHRMALSRAELVEMAMRRDKNNIKDIKEANENEQNLLKMKLNTRPMLHKANEVNSQMNLDSDRSNKKDTDRSERDNLTPTPRGARKKQSQGNVIDFVNSFVQIGTGSNNNTQDILVRKPTTKNIIKHVNKEKGSSKMLRGYNVQNRLGDINSNPKILIEGETGNEEVRTSGEGVLNFGSYVPTETDNKDDTNVNNNIVNFVRKDKGLSNQKLVFAGRGTFGKESFAATKVATHQGSVQVNNEANLQLMTELKTLRKEFILHKNAIDNLQSEDASLKAIREEYLKLINNFQENQKTIFKTEIDNFKKILKIYRSFLEEDLPFKRNLDELVEGTGNMTSRSRAKSTNLRLSAGDDGDVGIEDV